MPYKPGGGCQSIEKVKPKGNIINVGLNPTTHGGCTSCTAPGHALPGR